MANTTREVAAGLIGGLYSIDFAQPLADAAPPLTAYAANRHALGGFMAVLVKRGWQVRVRALGSLAGMVSPHIMAPLAHGPAPLPSGEMGYFVICPAPPGPSLLQNLRPWAEAELMDLVLKPMAAALAELQDRDVTHRSIRADNVFQPTPRASVTLGCAWAMPPASAQPGWMEPPYSALCLPAGRGDGRIADDVYALGALMMMLALGMNPVNGVPDEEVLRNKLDVGSYDALIGTHRLPPNLADLLRGMLADDPEHRPSPTLLANPAAARARRIAAKLPRRAPRPFDVGTQPAWTARMLAHSMARSPEIAGPMLWNGTMERWLRLGVGDVTMAALLDESSRLRDADAADSHADAMSITRAVAVLDPGAPLVWRQLALWPDGLGSALDHALHHAPEQVDALTEIARMRVATEWAERRGAGRDNAVMRLESLDTRHWFGPGRKETGPWRLCYQLNPLVPCQSPAIARAWTTRLLDLLPALEANAARGPRGDQPLVDGQVVAFIEARRDDRLDVDLGRLAAAMKATDLLSQLRLLARLQEKVPPIELPNLSQWAVGAVQPLLQQFSSRSRRERLAKRLAALSQAGHLSPIVAVLDDEPEQASDDAGLAAARIRLAHIEMKLVGWTNASYTRVAQARRVGHEVSDSIGLLACIVAFGLAVFG